MNKELKGYLEQVLIALAVTGVFLLVAGVLLALFGSFGALAELALGFAVLWGCVLGAAAIAAAITRLFRLNPYDTSWRFVVLHLLSTVPIALGWSAFAAAWARAGGGGVGLYALGLLSCYIALQIVTALASGQLYQLVCFFVGVAGFVAFALLGR
jgi:hypothetical protein